MSFFGRIIAWMMVWVVQVGLWLVYVSQVQKWEIVVGSAAAGVATVGVALYHRRCSVKFSVTPRQVAQVWRMPWYAITGTWEIMRGMAQELFSRGGAPSRVAAVAFDAGPDNAAGAGRRALAVFYTTMTPNFIVLGVVQEQGLLLYHQIIPGEVLRITQNLGARA